MDIPAGGALLDAVVSTDFYPGFNLEGFPNRDSVHYESLYGISEANTLMRGTFRYKGYCNVIIGLLKLGLLDQAPHPRLHPQGPEISWVCTIIMGTFCLYIWPSF